MEEEKEEVSTSNSNLVLTTAEIHHVPHVGYAGNAVSDRNVLEQLGITFRPIF